MKTTSFSRVLIAIVAITAFACAEPEYVNPVNDEKPITREFHTSVTTWTPVQENEFTGLVSCVPITDLSQAELYTVIDGSRLYIEKYPFKELNNALLWSSTRNNILVLHYRVNGPGKVPPPGLEIAIVY